jgi:hypothetical protein
MCGDKISVVDGDRHDEKGIPSVYVLELLMETEPGLFDSHIIEQTPSKGLHIYNHGIPKKAWGEGNSVWNIFLYGAGSQVQTYRISLEVLRGKKLCYCWPTQTDKGDYTLLSRENFLNTRPEELPLLDPRFPDRFYKASRDYIEDRVRTAVPVIVKSKVEAGDFSVIIDHFMRKTYCDDRHPSSFVFAMNVRALSEWGYDVGRGELIRLVQEYIESRGRKLSDPGEAERQVDSVFKAPIGHLDEKNLPWKDIWKGRRRRADYYMGLISGRRVA